MVQVKSCVQSLEPSAVTVRWMIKFDSNLKRAETRQDEKPKQEAEVLLSVRLIVHLQKNNKTSVCMCVHVIRMGSVYKGD